MATYFLSKKCLKNPVFKATPHKDCRTDAQSDFSSDCPKRCRNTGVFQGVLGKNNGKTASVCAAKRGVAYIPIFNQVRNLIKDWYYPTKSLLKGTLFYAYRKIRLL